MLCLHGQLPYDAVCLKAELKGKSVRYLVHYIGWNKRCDEWVPACRLRKLNVSDIKKQQKLKNIPKNIPVNTCHGHSRKGHMERESRRQFEEDRFEEEDGVVDEEPIGQVEEDGIDDEDEVVDVESNKGQVAEDGIEDEDGVGDEEPKGQVEEDRNDGNEDEVVDVESNKGQVAEDGIEDEDEVVDVESDKGQVAEDGIEDEDGVGDEETKGHEEGGIEDEDEVIYEKSEIDVESDDDVDEALDQMKVDKLRILAKKYKKTLKEKERQSNEDRKELDRLRGLLQLYRKTLEGLLSTTDARTFPSDTIRVEPDEPESENEIGHDVTCPESKADKKNMVAARKLTNAMMTQLFTAAEMSSCVMIKGHKHKKQIDQTRLAKAINEVKCKYPLVHEELVRRWIGDKLSNHAKTAKRALQQQTI